MCFAVSAKHEIRLAKGVEQEDEQPRTRRIRTPPGEAQGDDETSIFGVYARRRQRVYGCRSRPSDAPVCSGSYIAKKEEGTWVKVVEEAKVTQEPQEFKFKVHQVDGWYESDPEKAAWITRDANGEIYALSPICKHLGCTIGWNTDQKNEYVCPCHDARYSIDGKNLTVAPQPLDEYELKIENGFVYLGPLKPNSRVS
ncbi:hypothetical protein PACILC2_23390 [Paenibacillus cisolokensis]|uniref:Rieske domain-containing protein n=1 Tax=Paenibacillus cisolokensis TaxID=1658519 RepID=A0ABQ4N6I2_9BACL|nr:hypothetical protein PACILC2_23390 [Paenibacillus cisolokensis]